MDLTPEAIRRYEAAGAVVKKARQSIRPAIKEGAMSLDIAELVERRIIDEGALPAFPCNIGINDVASHHTPSACDTVVLKTGDVVKVDMGASVDGYVADIAFTVEIGTREHAGLIGAAESALAAGLARIRPGVMVREVGGAIENEAASRGFHVIKDLLGHSLSRYCLHGGLTVPAYDDGSERKIKKGDVLAIEPFLTAGSGAITRMDGGNIYQLIRNDEIYVHGLEEKKLLRYISERFGSFPFAGRWLPDTDMLQELVRAACVKSYPMMVETDGMPVAQAEHTVIVEEGGCRMIA